MYDVLWLSRAYLIHSYTQSDLKLNIEIQNAHIGPIGAITLDIHALPHNATLQAEFKIPAERAAVIVPCYNCANTVDGTLISLLTAADVAVYRVLLSREVVRCAAVCGGLRCVVWSVLRCAAVCGVLRCVECSVRCVRCVVFSFLCAYTPPHSLLSVSIDSGISRLTLWWLMTRALTE